MGSVGLVHIVGSGHSSSTLLDMLLGGHSKISSLGEVHRLSFNANSRTPADVCTCGRHVLECDFWQAVERELRAISGLGRYPNLCHLEVADMRRASLRGADGRFRPPTPEERAELRNWLNESVLVLGSRTVRQCLSHLSRQVGRQRRISQNLLVLYEAVRRAHGTPIVVDSTKNPGTFKGVYLEYAKPMAFILVLRDGRAVCASRMRREGVSMRDAAGIWRREHCKRIAAMATIPRARTHVVRYEALAENPARVLAGLCDRLGIEYEPSMIEFRHGRHNLGGNPMRLRSLEREIRVDDRWKNELCAADLAEFQEVAGALNRRLGYANEV